MKRRVAVLLLIMIYLMLLISSCGSKSGLPTAKDPTSDRTPSEMPSVSPFVSPSVSLSVSPSVSNASAQNTPAQTVEDNPTKTVSERNFSSTEDAYYSKYVELAEKYETFSLYDVKGDRSERSYLGGVCIVNLMDFNRDMIKDLFIVYSNGKMNRFSYDWYNLEIFDFPVKTTYDIEIWTYKDGGLTQLLHESCVSSGMKYPNLDFDVFQKYYHLFVNVYEDKAGVPVVQLFDESDGKRQYTNIYDCDGKIIRDSLTNEGDKFWLNGKEITENVWSENVAGFNKILLCALLADSDYSYSSVLKGYDIDYTNTLQQTEKIIRYLSQRDKALTTQSFYVAEGEYISLYLQEIERANRTWVSTDYMENHYYNLYDMDQDGVPELILFESSSGAGTHYHFYTIQDGELKDCGYCGRTSLFINGSGVLVAYYARMNGYILEEITLEGASINIAFIDEGLIHGDEEYPSLDEYGYNGYDSLAFCPPAIPMVLYTYHQSLPKE